MSTDVHNGDGNLSPLIGKPSVEHDEDAPRSTVTENGQNGGIPNGGEEILSHRKRETTVRRPDEYEVDFSDTREFAVFRWNDMLKATVEKLSPSDLEMAAEYRDWQTLQEEIHKRISDLASPPTMKRQMSKIQPLPRGLSTLTRLFSKLVVPLKLESDLLWSLIYLNLKLSYASPDRLKRTTEWLNRIRQVVELFNRCVEACEELNESRIAVVDFLEPIVTICLDSISYLHECSSDSAAEEGWPALSDSISTQIYNLDATVKHVNDITSFSKVNIERKIRNMTQKYALMPESEEPGKFPIRILPFRQNPRFYGRKAELEKINMYLSPKDDQSLRTYTIYGRRGVGKTEIAVQFAFTNHANFDAIFWIQCETSVAIRQSFTNVAVSLDLPGAEREGRHEENLLKVKNWLKKTKQDQILRGYWPIGASGAILITSRKYYNFSKDMLRQGDTVKPFNPKQSWDLLLQLLGEDWKKLDREGRLPQSEVAAATSMLAKLEGLALAIQQAAILIKNPAIGGPTIVKTYEMFKERIRTLPERHSSGRSSSETALDALWDMIFNSLSKNARVLLGVLAWLSPDEIPAQLFMPRNQSALEGSLAFCKQDPIHIDRHHHATLYSIMTPSTEFGEAIGELLEKELVKQDGRVYSIHRVVQEATNYHDVDDLQDSFDIASRLVYEAFPKQYMNQSLYQEWGTCQSYIPHGVQLSKKYSDHVRSGVLKASEAFVRLLCNSAWYLYEMSDYDACVRVTDTAAAACENKSSVIFAEILNIAGGRFYELNRLAECRKAWEATLRIRKERLPHNHVLMGAIHHNLGNLKTATGNLEESMDHFDRATLIWVSGRDATATQLALTYLCVGRVHILRGQFAEAKKLVAHSEALFVMILGADKGFNAHVHFAYGNIEYLQGRWDAAYRSYDSCLKIALAEMPIHPITAAAYYSLACVEFELGHAEVAKGLLDKAKAIAELRCPTHDDGVIARILWKTAVVLESDTYGTYATEAADMRRRAEVARLRLLASGEGGIIPFIDEDDAERNQEEDSYDALVPLYFR